MKFYKDYDKQNADDADGHDFSQIDQLAPLMIDDINRKSGCDEATGIYKFSLLKSIITILMKHLQVRYDINQKSAATNQQRIAK